MVAFLLVMFLVLSFRFFMCCSMSIHILIMSAFLMVHIPLQLMVKIFPGGSIQLKGLLLFLLGGIISVSVYSFWGSGLLLLWISLSERMLYWYTWNGIYFYLTLGFLDSISVSQLPEFCHGICGQHHTIQCECSLLCQIHLAGLWRFCNSFSGTYYLLVLL